MMNIPIFIPHLGCNNSCAFCSQRHITGIQKEPTIDQVKEIIEKHLLTKKGECQIAFFGGSFTGIEMDKQNAYLKVAKEYLDSKDISGIRLSTRPDYINDEIVSNLKNYGVTNIELGAQSMDEDVLIASKRGHDSDAVRKASEIINKANITLGLQMMTGLPLDNDEKSIKTAKEFIRLGAKETRIYPCLVVKGTLLEEMYNKGEYTPQTVCEAVEIASKLYKLFTENNVSVLRIGLMNSENLKESVVAGPYHDAIGEMVISRVILHFLEDIAQEGKDLNIRVNPVYMSKLVGQKKYNINYLETVKNTNVNIVQDDKIKCICVNDKFTLTI